MFPTMYGLRVAPVLHQMHFKDFGSEFRVNFFGVSYGYIFGTQDPNSG